MKKPECKLIGEDGNIFNLMAKASKVLKDNGMEEEAKRMCDEIQSCKSYDEALCTLMDYVEII